MPDGSWKDWEPVIIPVVTGLPVAIFAWLANRGTARNAAAKERGDNTRATAELVFTQAEAIRTRQTQEIVDAQAEVARERTAGLHWRDLALAWSSRAWSKLGMARGLREDLIEAREFAASERRVWFGFDPASASAARRPSWMGPAPDFAIHKPPHIPDPPGLEDILKS